MNSCNRNRARNPVSLRPLFELVIEPGWSQVFIEETNHIISVFFRIVIQQINVSSGGGPTGRIAGSTNAPPMNHEVPANATSRMANTKSNHRRFLRQIICHCRRTSMLTSRFQRKTSSVSGETKWPAINHQLHWLMAHQTSQPLPLENSENNSQIIDNVMTTAGITAPDGPITCKPLAINIM